MKKEKKYKFFGTSGSLFKHGSIYEVRDMDRNFCRVKLSSSKWQQIDVNWFLRNFEEFKDSSEIEVVHEVVEPNTNDKRVFESGASRNSNEGKLDFDGFLSTSVLLSYAKYMHKNRIMEDGTLRDSDNWQKGIPIVEYRKSMWRHFVDVWTASRDDKSTQKDRVANLNALLFNVMGMLHEELKGS